VFIGPTVLSFEGFPHHVEFGLAVPFEDARIAVPKHQCNKMVCHSSGAESRCERVTQLA
jgi:hypothetical protein